MPHPNPQSRPASVLQGLRPKDLVVAIALAAGGLHFGFGLGAAGPGHSTTSGQRTSGVAAAPRPDQVGSEGLPLVTEVAPPSYAAQSVERAVFDALNEARARGNFGLLAQDPRLDAAAAGHAAYMALNLHGDVSHRQDAKLPGFTGETPAARIRAAGYETEHAFEAISSGTSARACLQLLNTVYHLGALMVGATDVGIGVHADAGCVIEPQLPRHDERMQSRRAGTVGVYPYPGQTGVPAAFMPATETPNPAPDLGDAVIGPPVLVDLNSRAASGLAAGEIVLHRLSLTEAGGTTPVAARILASRAVKAAPGSELDVRVDRRLLSAGHVFLLPLQPLAPGASHAVEFSGTVNGTHVSLRWQFATAH